ncbi:MAG TPA: FkbM family methyltransferase [Rhodopila sp.]|jgi:FkbM family methyltransferase|nr:FkbM family methyltransferase [Rhodopila sp.]
MPREVDRQYRQFAFRGALRGAVSRLQGAPRWLVADLQARLVHIEDKVDDTRTGELRERLIHIEQKLDGFGGGLSRPADGADSSFAGHADQAFGHFTYAQFGEDLIVAGLFARLGIDRPNYLDIGAHHPLNCSNTALLHAHGSRGVNVEANPTLIEAFHRLRPDDVTLNCGVGPIAGEMTFYRIDEFSGRNTFDRETAEAFVRSHPEFKISDTVPVTVRTINDIVSVELKGRWPDLLSLDAEGLDRSILESADFNTAGPKVIIVEAISGDNADASEDLSKFLVSSGYVISFQTPGNLIAVRADAAAVLQPVKRPELVAPHVADLDPVWAERIRTAATCSDADELPRVPNAGGFVIHDGHVCQVMHNGVLILRDSYIGPPMSTLIAKLRGVHEPQEERCFAEVLPHLRAGATMIELGANWGFYSLWFYRSIEQAKCHLIEVDLKLLEAGIRNFELNGALGIFTNAGLGEPDLDPWQTPRRGRYLRALPSGQIFFERGPAIPGLHRNIPIVDLNQYIEDNLIEHIGLLHCDIQGGELFILRKNADLFRSGRIDWLFISTHHDDTFHLTCLREIEDLGFVVVAQHNVSQSYSGDGLVVAKRPGTGGPDNIPISHRNS